jgi:hypothetical protein
MAPAAVDPHLSTWLLVGSSAGNRTGMRLDLRGEGRDQGLPAPSQLLGGGLHLV